MTEESLKPKLITDLGLEFTTINSKQKSRFGIYECQFCKEPFKGNTYSIASGNTKSCGCQKDAHKIKHGLYDNKFYQTWNSMMHRCYDKKAKSYSTYGARGITVCQDWHDVTTFIKWAENTYITDMTMDRKDNNKGYSPDNCRWADLSTQANNQKMMKSNTSGYVGISEKNGKWQANIKINNKTKYIGSFNNKIEAAEARDKYITDNNLPHRLNF